MIPEDESEIEGGELSEKDRLLEVFDKFRDALFSNDVQTMKDLMAEDYIGYDPLGNPQDKSISIDAYQPGRAKLDTYDVDDLEVRIIGEVGIITGKGHIHGTFAGSEFEHRLRFLDLYINRDGKWQLYMSQVTELEEV